MNNLNGELVRITALKEAEEILKSKDSSFQDGFSAGCKFMLDYFSLKMNILSEELKRKNE